MSYDHNILGVGNTDHPANEQPNNEPLTYDEAMDFIKRNCPDDLFEAISAENMDLHRAITERNEIIERLKQRIKNQAI